jgi:hypothetical protein
MMGFTSFNPSYELPIIVVGCVCNSAAPHDPDAFAPYIAA